MTSKEALKNIMNIACKLGNGTTYEEDEMLDNCKKIVLKDLDKLEQYEAIFKEPLKDIRERLEILEILKKHLNYSEAKDLDTSAISKENYNITIFKSLYKEDFNKIKQWLEADKNG